MKGSGSVSGGRDIVDLGFWSQPTGVLLHSVVYRRVGYLITGGIFMWTLDFGLSLQVCFYTLQYAGGKET